LHSNHPETVYLHEQGCEGPWFFFEDRGFHDQKYLGNAAVEEGSANFGRTAWKGRRRTGRSGSIFHE